MGKFACFMLLALVVMEISATDYCSICPDQHTMCIYPDVGPMCAERLYWGVKFWDKMKIVNLHNQHRRFVARGWEWRGDPGPQPSATNMASLVWDEELERVAQRWANQCNFGHDTCRNVPRYNWVGQNVAIFGVWRSDGVHANDTQDWDAAISGFYNEVAYFNDMNVGAFGTYPDTTEETGHYTQLVWAETTRVGCGFVGFIQNRDGKDWFMKYYVCNYAPGGNVLGEPVYQQGFTCSQCSSGTRCILGLCTISWMSLISGWFSNILYFLNLQ